jgi:phage-related protein
VQGKEVGKDGVRRHGEKEGGGMVREIKRGDERDRWYILYMYVCIIKYYIF